MGAAAAVACRVVVRKIFFSNYIDVDYNVTLIMLIHKSMMMMMIMKTSMIVLIYILC